MIGDARWLLPEGIEELLPPAAWRLEQLRRRLLDLYRRWGYELVIPPLIEFLESLLTGTGNDLELETFKLIDQLSGRLLGIRADITPQVARIDAHRLKRALPTRLCYFGTVLHTRGDGFGGSRSPLQIGAEIYGHAGYESDLEVVSLLLETLATAGLNEAQLDLGHVSIFRCLVRQAGLSQEQEAALFEALQRKALPEIREQLQEYGLAAVLRDSFLALAELNGDEEVLTVAERRLPTIAAEIEPALAGLRYLAATLRRRLPTLPISFDLAELRGYNYHTGLVFAAYVPGYGQEVARGGRYDNIGRVFGRPRPATGFSADLRLLLRLGNGEDRPTAAIYAPACSSDTTLETRVNELRQQGECVIRDLPGDDPGPRAFGCERVLQRQGDDWIVVPVVT
ncbi:MAG: ATP phosphoribosyltransferase regulatory subunit [Candidatus Competibacteraceae bacterium]